VTSDSVAAVNSDAVLRVPGAAAAVVRLLQSNDDDTRECAAAAIYALCKGNRTHCGDSSPCLFIRFAIDCVCVCVCVCGCVCACVCLCGCVGAANGQSVMRELQAIPALIQVLGSAQVASDVVLMAATRATDAMSANNRTTPSRFYFLSVDHMNECMRVCVCVCVCRSESGGVQECWCVAAAGGPKDALEQGAARAGGIGARGTQSTVVML
jgi:hypothetical protein